VSNQCYFSSDITEQLSCCKDGNFDNYGFPINICSEYPCKKYIDSVQSINKRVDEFYQKHNTEIGYQEHENKGATK